MSEPMRGVQRSGAVAAVVAAVLLILGTISPTWWSGDKGSLAMGVGLHEVELCSSLSCVTRGLEGLGGGSTTWPKLGAVGFALGWGASALLVVAALLVFLRRPLWAARLGRSASAFSLFALVVGGGFAWTYPGFEGLGVGWGLAAYLGGAAIGVGGAGILIASVGSRRAA